MFKNIVTPSGCGFATNPCGRADSAAANLSWWGGANSMLKVK